MTTNDEPDPRPEVLPPENLAVEEFDARPVQTSLIRPRPAPGPTTPTDEERKVLDRVRRILAGDIRGEDYLPVPDEVVRAVEDYLKQVEEDGHFTTTAKAKQHLLNEWTFLHHHSKHVVLARFTDRGVIVLAMRPDIGLLHEHRIVPIGFTLISPIWD